MKKNLLLLVSCLLTASALANGLPTTPYIYVVGSAEARVKPDTLTVKFSISAVDHDPNKAKSNVSKKSASTFELLGALGIAENSITAFDISLETKRDYESKDKNFREYEVTRNFEIRIVDFSLYPKLVDGLFALGIQSLDNVQPSYSKTPEEQSKLKNQALTNARKQAEEIATTLNAKVSSVFAASPIEFGDISRGIFGARGAFASAKFGANGADTYIFASLLLAQNIHVIFLIEPKQ